MPGGIVKEFPCQKCQSCKKTKFSAKMFRTKQEGKKVLTPGYFLTLTFRPEFDEYLRLSDIIDSPGSATNPGDRTLRKEISFEKYLEYQKNPALIKTLTHVAGKKNRLSLKKQPGQLFMYRLRITQDRLIQKWKGSSFYPVQYTNLKRLCENDRMETIEEMKERGDKRLSKKNSIRYAWRAEYGKKHSRPHYHYLRWNVIPEVIDECWDFDDHEQMRLKRWSQAKNESACGSYLMAYMSKPDIIPQFEGDNRLKEFNQTSRHWGAAYITNQTTDWHNDPIAMMDGDIRLYCNDIGKTGMPKKARMDRYYRQKMISEDRLLIMQEKLLKQMIDKKIEDEEMRQIMALTEEGRRQLHNEKVAIADQTRKWKLRETTSIDGQ